MVAFVELVRTLVPSVVVPIVVFGGNWAVRYKSGYAQTAATDFILAILAFDGAVITGADAFEPFIRDPDLRQIAVQWHWCLGAAGCFLWWLIATFGEPIVAAHYAATPTAPSKTTFFLTLMVCWTFVFILISAHIGYFTWGAESNV